MFQKTVLTFLIALLAGMSGVNAQGFEPPQPGKAVVYFVRPSKSSMLTSFEYFHNDQYIGIFKGKNYMRYECDPGANLFWVSSENKEFVTADLAEGGTYLIGVEAVMGVAKSRVNVYLITVKDAGEFSDAAALIRSRPPVETPSVVIRDMNIQLADFIRTKLAQYETEWKTHYTYPHISADMAIPLESMK
jgi:hypothetical protein